MNRNRGRTTPGYSGRGGRSSRHRGYSDLDRSRSPDNIMSQSRGRHFQNMSSTSGSRTKAECQAVIDPFDIFLAKIGTPVMLKPSFLVKNREKRNEIKRSTEGQNGNVLRSGMVLLKKYLSLSDQVKIVKACQKLGLASGGFYQPGIPREFHQLVEKAIKDSHSLIQEKARTSHVENIFPWMTPNICIVNFYSASGRLGLHQNGINVTLPLFSYYLIHTIELRLCCFRDRDASPESLHKALPVVSFSIGDSAEFLYGDQRVVDKAEKVELESGDVLIFGGNSRHIFHGVTAIKQNTAPRGLLEETNIRPGHLNLTFREY
ncbi:hypothetical protein REPUB_Repub13aG0197800 [Reevesia pubescens]